jgi:hypothetical protein
MRRGIVIMAALLFPLVLAAASGAAGPSLTVIAPKAGEVIQSSSVTVEVTTSDFKIVPSTVPVSEAGKRPDVNRPGEGHLHFVLDLQPLVVWDQADAYTFKDLPPGQHQLMVELANNDHASLSPPVMKQIRFETVAALPATGTLWYFDPGLGSFAAMIGAALLLFGWSAHLRRVKRA